MHFIHSTMAVRVAIAIAALAAGTACTAQSGWYNDGPNYYEPAPRYRAPPPVYYQQPAPPTYYQQPPQYYGPQPGYGRRDDWQRGREYEQPRLSDMQRRALDNCSMLAWRDQRRCRATVMSTVR